MSVKLGEISEIKSGYQQPPRSSLRKDINGTHRLVFGKNISPVGTLEGPFLQFSPDRKPERYEIRPNDILFLARGTEHKSICVGPDIEPNLLASSNFYIIRIKTQTVLPCFLAWYMNQQPAREYYEVNSAGATIAYISKPALAALSVPVIPIERQQTIVKLSRLRDTERVIEQQLTRLRDHLVGKQCLKALDKGDNV